MINKSISKLQLSIENNTYSESDIKLIIQYLDSGKLRVAEKKGEIWKVNTWVKEGIMKYFGVCTINESKIGDIIFRDKLPLKQNFKNVRIVPGGNAIRFGSYLAENVIMMPPSYVNIGAFIGENTMIDSNVLVGSCAQIGANVHLSAAVQIGGVLEPINASPVIIEDNVFVGAGAIVVEGVIIKNNAVIAPGVILSASTKIIETDKKGIVINTFYGVIPPNAIVVPGARTRGEIIIQTPIIIGYRDTKTNVKVQLSDFLRNF